METLLAQKVCSNGARGEGKEHCIYKNSSTAFGNNEFFFFLQDLSSKNTSYNLFPGILCYQN